MTWSARGVWRASLFAVLAFVTAGAAARADAARADRLLPSLRPYAQEVLAELEQVAADRQALLRDIAAVMVERLAAGQPADLTFICTHNSPRSHMSQVWAQAAAHVFDLERVRAFSGGTEITACNCRTVLAMRRAGFAIETRRGGENPLLLVRYAEERPPVRAYSKLYHADDNPKRDFIALMTCSKADRSCPVVEGAIARFPIHYMDPRLCDDTPEEAAAYNARCREIAREMFFLMREVRQRLDQRAARSATAQAPPPERTQP
jgi:arsenate reductase